MQRTENGQAWLDICDFACGCGLASPCGQRCLLSMAETGWAEHNWNGAKKPGEESFKWFAPKLEPYLEYPAPLTKRNRSKHRSQSTWDFLISPSVFRG